MFYEFNLLKFIDSVQKDSIINRLLSGSISDES